LNESPLRQQKKQYTLRKRGLRGLLAFLLVATAAVIVLALWAAGHRNASVTSRRENLPQNVARQLSGYTFTRSEQGRELFTVHASRTLNYNQGSSTVLDDVHVIIFGRTGKDHDEIEAQHCLYNTLTGALACSGDALISLPAPTQNSTGSQPFNRPPLMIHTSNPSYDPRSGVVKTNAPVRFQYGVDSGAAIGMIYRTQAESLELEKRVALELEPEPDSNSPVRITAGRLFYAKQSGQLTLQSPVRLSETGRHLTGATAVLYLDSHGRATRATLAGGVQGAAVLPNGTIESSSDTVDAFLNPETAQVDRLVATGAVRLAVQHGPEENSEHLFAQHAILNFAGQPAHPKDGAAIGDVHVVYEPAPAHFSLKAHTRESEREKKTVLTTGELHFRFRPNGVLAAASTVGPGVIHLIPLNAADARQTITAGKFLMAFDAVGRLKAVDGHSGTRVVSTPGPEATRGREIQTSTADELHATLNSSAGTIDTVRQAGKFQFWQGDRRASSNAANYHAALGRLTLRGDPVMWDGDNRTKANHIQINLDEGTAKAWDSVQSLHFGASGHPAPSALTASHRSDTVSEPLIVTADQLTANKNSQIAHYQGRVKAWYGPDVVECSSLDVDRRREQVRSGTGVLTTLLQAQENTGDSASKRSPSQQAEQPLTIRADHLVYFNLGQEAVYRGHVHAVSGSMTLNADRLETYFSKPATGGQPTVTKVVANGSVTAVQLPDRHATGQHAVYYANLGKVILTGGPPIIYDAKQGVLTAKRLTFFTYDDSLIADGGPKAPALSRYHVVRQ
jgi:lipopolysaccharide export system protein LptA